MTRFAVTLAGAIALLASNAVAGSHPARARAPVVQTTPPPAGQTPPANPDAARVPDRGARGRGALRGALQMPDPQTMGPGQIDQLFDALVIFQAQPALNLTDDQWLTFGQKLKLLQNLRRRLQRERMATLNGLREMLKTQSVLDDAVVAEKIKEYDDQLLQTSPELRQAYAAIDQVLKPRQRMQFRVFEENMERRKLDLIAMARQRQQIKQTPPPAPTPAPVTVKK
jgi:hypothetical protein